jgi:hypothetical protein
LLSPYLNVSICCHGRGYEHFGQKYDHSRKYMIAAAGAGTFGYVYYLRSLEEVPFTHRKHAILLVTPAMERTVGEHTFDEVKADGCLSLLFSAVSLHPPQRGIRFPLMIATLFCFP